MTMPSIFGIKKLPPGQSTYIINENFQRFNQKYNLIYQGDWNPKLGHLSNKAFSESRTDKIKNNMPGYSRLDLAYMAALTTNLDATNFSINVPNSGGTSWSPLERDTFLLGKELDKWIGDHSTTDLIKSFALSVGADDVGVCKLDRRWVYSHYYDVSTQESFPIRFSDEPGYENFNEPGKADDNSLVIPSSMKYVIVFIENMDIDGIATAPTMTHYATTYQSYSKIGYVTMAVAEFIRTLGYNAIPSSNDTAINIPLAIDAGLGELGRNIKLIHPVFGPRCRIAKVITDLPLIPDSPISFGVTEFCETCKKCAKRCPSKALSMEERSFDSVGDYSCKGLFCWQADHARCRDFWIKIGTNCGLCIHVCPFNKPKGLTHTFTKSIIASTTVLNRFIVSLDDFMKHGKPMLSNDFWHKFSKRYKQNKP